MFGQLQPHDNSEPIPLVRPHLVVGRRESCDIVLRYAYVSAVHCELDRLQGHWFVTDSVSRCGVLINGVRVPYNVRQRLNPGDEIAVGKSAFIIDYDTQGLDPADRFPDDDPGGDGETSGRPVRPNAPPPSRPASAAREIPKSDD